jgi:Winged helix DNA-binding domain
VRTIEVSERRARLSRRHRLSPEHRASDVVDAARSLVCLHATDPATIYLSARARVDGMQIADLDKAMYADRTLVKHLAMRRTLFVFPRETLGIAQAGASNRVADIECRRLISRIEKAGLHTDATRWLADAQGQVLALLADGREVTSTELRQELPVLEGAMTYGEGKKWGGRLSLGPQVLTTLSAAGRIVRATNVGSWTASRPRWASMSAWLGDDLETVSDADGVAGLVEKWLRAFGPGTAADIKWWLGSTVAAVRKALADLEAVEVDLDGQTGYLLPDDLEPVDPVEPWAALLPMLDPTIMGWYERDWYLGDHRPQLFDSNGNAGPTIWWDGRVVGGWRQSESGDVIVQLLDDIGSDGRRAVEHEADRLTEWLDGTRVMPRFPSPLWKNDG